MKVCTIKNVHAVCFFFALLAMLSSETFGAEPNRANALRGTDDPTLNSTAFVPGGAAVITLSDKKNTFAAKYSSTIGGELVLSVGVSAPWKTNNNIGSIANLDGLGGSASITLGISRTFWPNIVNENKIIEYCQGFELVEERLLLNSSLSGEKKQEIRNDFSSCDSDLIEKYFLATPPGENLPELQELNNTWKAAFRYDRPIFGMGIDAEYSNPRISYVDSTTLEKDSDDVDNYNITATVTAFTPGKNSLFKISAARSKSHRIGSSNICLPIGSDGALSCNDTSLGPPSEATGTSVAFEYRRRLARIAFAVSVTRDLKIDETLVSLPLWLNEISGVKGYRPGVRLDWDSETENASATVFIGLFNLL